MKNLRFVVLLALCLLFFDVSAQGLRIEKINSYRKVEIKLPKKIKIKYVDDSIQFKERVKAIGYEFPYLTIVRNKNDTMILDVRNIVLVKKNTLTKNVGLALLGAFSYTVTVVTIFASIFVDDPSVFVVIAPLAYLDYKTAVNFGGVYDTKDTWSFY